MEKLGIFVLIWIFLILCIYDDIVLDHRYANKIIYGKNCELIVSKGYEIRYIDTEKKYAVASDYFYLGNIGPLIIIECMTPALFDDTCSAKAFLEAYLKQEEKRTQRMKHF